MPGGGSKSLSPPGFFIGNRPLDPVSSPGWVGAVEAYGILLRRDSWSLVGEELGFQNLAGGPAGRLKGPTMLALPPSSPEPALPQLRAGQALSKYSSKGTVKVLLPAGLALLLSLVLIAGISPEAFASSYQVQAQKPIVNPVVPQTGSTEDGTPVLSCEVNTQSFGDLIKGTPYEHVFQIKNLGDATLKITKVNGT